MGEEIDYRSDEMQNILDIKPTRVVVIKPEEKGGARGDTNSDPGNIPKMPNDVFDYFQLPRPKECLPDVLRSIKEIVNTIKGEVENNDDFFMLLKGIEDISLSDKTDPLDRLKAVLNFVKVYKTNIKETLDNSGVFNSDLLAEEAQRTGNWAKFLRQADHKRRKVKR